MNQLRDNWDRDITPEEKQTERKCTFDFDKPSGNPVMNIPKYISESFEGDERTYMDKEGHEIVSSFMILFLAQNASGFDSWVVLKSLD